MMPKTNEVINNNMEPLVLETEIVIDEHVATFCAKYDLTPSTTSTTTIHLPDLEGVEWTIGCLYGPSGTGKTTIGKSLSTQTHEQDWDSSKSIISQLGEDAMEICSAVGLHSIPSLLRPFGTLSLGEQKRCTMAALCKELKDCKGVIFVDEFCSALDIPTSFSLAKNIAKFIRKNEQQCKILFASQRLEVLTMLRPDWIYSTRQFDYMPLTKPVKLWELEVIPITGAENKRKTWKIFKNHHYLSDSFNIAARCYLGVRSDTKEWIGFCAVLAQPGRVPNAWRGHRLVILPEYQGLGYGPQLDEHVAEITLARGKRYYSRTIHPRLGEYRERSTKWKATSKNRVWSKGMHGATSDGSNPMFKKVLSRLSYSHEYIGETTGEK